MTAVAVVAVATFASLTASILFFPEIKIGRIKVATYWVVALVGALVVLAAGLISVEDVFSALTANTAINPLKILALFFSMTFISVVLDELGLFRLLAQKAVSVAHESQIVLFFAVYALTSALTVFTSNDVVILTFTPFICFFCKHTGIDPLPYLVGEFAAANTWSMMLMIGNPTNIYLATYAGIDFIPYFKVMALPTVAAGVAEIAVIFLIFGRKLKKKLVPEKDDFRPENVAQLVVGIAHLAVCLVFLVISGSVGVEMWLVSVLCALSLGVCMTAFKLFSKKAHSHLVLTALRLPWQLVPFVISMFVLVICLDKRGVSEVIGRFFGENNVIFLYGGTSFLSANLINNIPMSILFSSISSSLEGTEYLRAVYAVVVGSNVGAFLTPVGALAGIMFTDLTKKYGVNYGFKNFIKYGALISLPTLAAALIVLFFTL